MSEVVNKWRYARNTDDIPACPRWRMHIDDARGYFGDDTRLAACLGFSDTHVMTRLRSETGLLSEGDSLRLWIFTRGAVPIRLMPQTIDYQHKGERWVATWYPAEQPQHDDAEPILKDPPQLQDARFDWPRHDDYYPDRRRGSRTAKSRRWWFRERDRNANQ